MRSLAIGLIILCASAVYADDIEDLERRIDDLESEIDDLRNPAPVAPVAPMPPGWTWRYVYRWEDPVNWGWQKVPPPKTAEELARERRVEECGRRHQTYVHPPGPGTLTLEYMQCLASE